MVSAIPTLVIVLAGVFILIRLTGDPARLYLGDFATDEAVSSLRSEWGLDRPMRVQFVDYLLSALRGDLGISLKFRRPVLSVIAERFGASLELALASMVIAVSVAVPLGALAALNRGKLLDRILGLAVVLGQAIPRFFLGILLIIIFGLTLYWLPTGGSGTLRHLILPAFTLATPTIALLARITRSSVLDVINQDYVRTAKGKGLKGRRILIKHVLRNALVAPLTVATVQFSQLIGGAVIVETVFSWPGLGLLAIESVYSRDFTLMQGIVLVFTILVILINVLVDWTYSIIDPRIRLSD